MIRANSNRRIQALAVAFSTFMTAALFGAPPSSTPPTTAPSAGEAWSYDLDGAGATTAWINGDTVYLLLQSGHDDRQRSQLSATPGLEPFKDAKDAAQRTDDPKIAAVDARGLGLRWVRAMRGELLFVPEPGGRDLWALGEMFAKLDADTGKTTREVPLEFGNSGRRPRYGARGITGLKINGRLAFASSRARNGIGTSATVYDIDENSVIEAHTADTTADGRWYIEKQDFESNNSKAFTRFAMLATEPGNARWYSDFPGYTANAPAIVNDDVIVLTGGLESAAAVKRLDSRNGIVRWSTPLPGGAYIVDREATRFGNTIEPTWSAVGRLDTATLYAIDANGVIYLLDAATGHIQGSTSVATHLLCAPKLLDGRLIIVDERSVIALPIDLVRGERADTAQARQDKAAVRATLLAGDLNAAWKAASVLASEWPDDMEAQRLALDAALRLPTPASERRANDDEETADEADTVINERARLLARWLEAGGTPGTAERDAFTLLGYTPTGPIAAAMLPAGRLLYAPGMDGILYILDTDERVTGSRVIASTRMAGAAWQSRLKKGNQLIRLGDSWSQELLATVTGVSTALTSAVQDDPLLSSEAIDGSFEVRGLTADDVGPPEWHEWSPGVGPIVTVNGRHIRALAGGDVRELTADGVVVHAHDPSKPMPGEWNLVRTANGLVGCGVGGVYALDENCRPTDRIIIPAVTGADAATALVAAADGPHMAVVIRGGGQSARLELWSGEPKRLVRKVTVLEPPRSDRLPREATRLTRCGNGYLYSGGELVWLPDDPTRRVWRFRTNDIGRQPLPGERSPRLQRDRPFGVPRFVGHRMFVANAAGGIYEFDVDAITR